MFTCVFIVYFLVLLQLSLSKAVYSPVPVADWLPKCCPEGKVLSSNGKACVDDGEAKDLDYEMANETTNFTSDILPIFINNQTVLYRLEHRSRFNCVRHEILAIDNDLWVSGEEEVVVTDWHGELWTLPRGDVCVDSVSLGSRRVFVALLCPSCRHLTCLHKCCPEDQWLQVSEDGLQVSCESSARSWSQELRHNSTDRAFVFHGFPECRNGMYLEFPEGPVGVSPEGHLVLPRMTVPRGEYCGDLYPRGSAVLGCRQPAPQLKPVMYGVLFCAGAVFLALTLVLHLWLPELRKTLHSRVLVAHVACLLVSYLGLAAANLAVTPAPSAICSLTAFIIQFSILAAIFWLNVMCVDIAWTFSGLRAPKASSNLDSDGHKFLYYSLYAWGSTVAISGLTALLEFSPLVPPSSPFKPGFGITSCWFRSWELIVLLVYGPMGVLLLVNAALFLYTAAKIRRTQRDVASLVQHTGSKLRENKNRFSLYLKLFGLMGVTWVFEIVSWVVKGPDSYWYLTDIINALRGVFIFALFCLKKKVVSLVKAKLFPKQASKFPSMRSASSKRTSSLSSQRTNSIQLSLVA